MDSQKDSPAVQRAGFLRRAWRAIRIPILTLAVLYAGLVIYRIPAAEERLKTEEAVKKIHAQRLALRDVTGENLPPQPDPALKDATVAGIDANGNGIRDDVELAIFKLHPDSARIRAAELQYAMDLQSELKWVFNSDTWVAAVKYEKGIGCLVDAAFDKYTDIKNQMSKSDEWEKEIQNLMLNTQSRISRKKDVDSYQTFFATGTKSCDVDLKQLSN